MRRAHLLILLILPLWILTAVTGRAAVSASRTPIPEDELLDIGIQIFDPGNDKRGGLLTGYEYINPDLRNSEAAFLAVHLMRTLQQTERFGLVRMMPSKSVSADLFVTGRIRESSGRRLEVALEVVDATGRRWLRRTYTHKADPAAHLLSFHSNIEPFQDVYDEFAADLHEKQRRMKDPYLEDLRRVAELRFAAQLAPGVFDGYLSRDAKGRVELDRLPARDDPMLARIRSIQTRDEFFLDLLTERFQAFYTSMDRPYDDFRATRFEVEMSLRDTRAQAILANAQSLFAPPDLTVWERRRTSRESEYFRRQAARQAGYLDEISNAFALDLEPLKLELDGEVIRFEGTIDDQYRQWQELLERIFETETGMSAKNRVFLDDLNAGH